MKSAILASISSSLVNRTVLIGEADIFAVLLDRAFEEALAALASSHAVMLTSRVVAAHSAQLIGRCGLLLLLL